MRNTAKRMALCAMLAALCVVLMLLGAVLELGMYAAPMLAGLLFIPVGQKYGKKYHALIFAASALLCFFIVPNAEQNLVFAGFLGWYPMVQPGLGKLPKWLRLPVKLVLFNGIIVAIEYVVLKVIAPDVIGGALLWVLLALANITFIAYDFMLPKLTNMLSKITKLL